MSPCYELLRYGHDIIKSQTIDAHTLGKLSKLIIGPPDLLNPEKSPTLDNFRFEICQFEAADVVVFVNNRISTVLKDC